MSRLGLSAATMDPRKITKDLIEETDCNECAEVDGFLIEADLDEELVGYYISNYDYPVCNHIDGVTSKNIGYAKGITAGGVPFETELIDEDDTLTMAVIIPAIFNFFYEGEENEEFSDKNITAEHCEVKLFDHSVLDIGMADGAMEGNREAVRDYVNFLVNNSIVTFTSNLISGTVLYRVDVLGNDLAKILITMREGEKFWAYTDIDFVEFPKKQKDV